MVTNELLKRKYWQVLIIGVILSLFVVYFAFSHKSTNYKEGAKLVHLEKQIQYLRG